MEENNTTTNQDTLAVLTNIMRALPQYKGIDSHGFWAGNGRIFCPNEFAAEVVAEFLRDMLKKIPTIEISVGGAQAGYYYVAFDREMAVSDAVPSSDEVKATLDGIMQSLPDEPRSYDTADDPGFWSRGCDILCPCEADAEIIADFIEDMLRSHDTSIDVHTGYYDPVEDAKAGECDDFTGFWYIDFD